MKHTQDVAHARNTRVHVYPYDMGIHGAKIARSDLNEYECPSTRRHKDYIP